MEKQAKFIDLKDVLLDFKKFPNEYSPQAFYALKGSIKGIIILTNLRISFVYSSDDNKIEHEEIIYSLVKSIRFKIFQDKTQIDIDYAYTRLMLTILDNYDANMIKSILNSVIPKKVSILELQDNLKYKNATALLNDEKSKKVTAFLSNEEQFKISLKLNKKIIFFSKILLFIIILLVFYLNISSKSNYLFKNIFASKEKVTYIISYTKNFIQIQKCQKDEFKMGVLLKEHFELTKEYPQNFTEFLRTNLKSTLNKDVSKDPWENYYFLETSNKKFKIISSGPDKKKNSIDDIITEFQ